MIIDRIATETTKNPTFAAVIKVITTNEWQANNDNVDKINIINPLPVSIQIVTSTQLEHHSKRALDSFAIDTSGMSYQTYTH